jgi:anthranilate synthase component 2
MQCINEAFGGCTVRSPHPMHGKTSWIEHSHEGIFKNVPSPFQAARYHSLAVRLAEQNAAPSLTITAYSQDGVIMGLSHHNGLLHGVQFHPESFLTEQGFTLVENFLNLGPLSLN